MFQRFLQARRVILMAAALWMAAFSGPAFAKPCASLTDDCYGMAACGLTCDTQCQPSIAVEAPPRGTLHGRHGAVAKGVVSLDGVDVAPEVPPPRSFGFTIV